MGDVKISKGSFPQKADALILPIFKGEAEKNRELKLIEQKSRIKLSEKLKREDFKGEENQLLALENTDSYDLVLAVGLGEKKDQNLSKLKNILAQAMRSVASKKASSIDLFVSPDLGSNLQELGKNISLSFYLSNYRFLKYKGEKERKQLQNIKSLNLYLQNEKDIKELKTGVEYGRKVAEGIYLVRDLVNEPASHLGVEDLEKIAHEIAKNSKGRIKVEVLDEAKSRKLGMGSFLGVAQGSDRKPKFIVLKSENGNKKRISFVGKTIIFDSGGLSLKPSEHMEDMKLDMAGGATVLGLFKVLADLDEQAFKKATSGKSIYGVLPACENMPSGKALRPGDIVHSLNGKTIEVLNTDAEGRLTLADGLTYAEKNLKSDYIIDIATLTGACMVALGDDLAGLFSNDDSFSDSFRKVADREGDELWPLPLYKDYLKRMKSEIADIKNVSGGRYGGAITAALFLKEFVDHAKWIHLDVAGPAFRNSEPKGVWPKGGTGWGVATLVEFVKEL